VTQEREGSAAERIIAAVEVQLEAGGPDSVIVREVARQARVSLRDVYSHFGSRDELIVTAVEEWMEVHVYQPLIEPPANTQLVDGLIRHFRHIYEPWERNPRMLEAYVYAQSTPSGGRLFERGRTLVEPITRSLFEGADAAYAEDVLLIIDNLVYALMARYAAGDVPLADIMPTIERVLRRLTAHVEPVRGST
jgi:AcrR family transcriptional regulator